MYLQLKLLFVQSKCLGQIQAPFGKTGKLKVTLLSFPSTSLQIGDKVVLRFWKEAANGPIKVKGNLTQPKDYLITEWLYPEVATEIQNPLPPPSPLPLPPKTSFTLDDKTTPLYALSLQDQTTIERKIRKEGQIERLKGETSQDGHNPFAIVVGLFQNEEEAQKAIGTKVYYNGDKHSSKKMDIGEIEKTFGKTGKVRVDFLKWTNGKGTLAQIGDSVYI
jgi:ribosomal protein L35AE/L33A